ncbi:MAG: sugar ABC transporter permease [Chloroflexi bacterium]|nr:MAG: sugar ABC transporter permease [Chloroflexota bacterium]
MVKKHGVWYLFLAPTFILFLVFNLSVWIFLFVLSFTNWSLLGEANWVGLDNFFRLTQDEVMASALKNTFLYVLMYVLPLAAISLGLAMLVNRAIRGIYIFRASFFLPVVTSIAVLAIIWSWLLIPRPNGPLNYFLGFVGIPPQGWLISPKLALPVLTGMTLWQRAGYFMLLWLAGLQSIPADLYDAAKIDGAGNWALFRNITLPLLKPTSVFVIIIATIEGFRMFAPVYILTGGGPANSTTTLVYYVWQAAFSRFEMGYAAAIAVVLFVIVLVVALIQRYYMGWGKDLY